MGLFKDKKKSHSSAREQSLKISTGGAEPSHIGKYTKEMIDQELFSLDNTKPAFRDQKWKKRAGTVRDAIMKKLSRNENSIICQFQLRKLEQIENVR